jgi:hypothetical protein
MYSNDMAANTGKRRWSRGEGKEKQPSKSARE